LYVLIACPADFDPGVPVRPTSELDWVVPGADAAAPRHGRGPVSLLPRGDDVVLVLPPLAVSWHPVALPRLPANRVRAALDGLLEDRLLDEVEQLHLALEPGARPGQTLWVAACRREPLAAWLALLQDAGHRVIRIVPALHPTGPDEEPRHWAFEAAGQPWLARMDSDGVAALPLAAVPPEAGPHGRWLADAPVAAAAEAHLQRPVSVVTWAQWLQRCADSPWNLAQFGFSLTAGARRGQRLAQAWQSFWRAPAWRPARLGLAALLAVQLLGLNLSAQMEQRAQAARRADIDRVLQQTFPAVTLVLDAPVQMQREVERLQRQAGVPDRSDLDSLLAALGQALPDNGSLPTPDRIGYRDGQLRLDGWRVEAARLQGLQDALAQAGWRLQADSEGLALTALPGQEGRP
jgi:general secretion pathway protein L